MHAATYKYHHAEQALHGYLAYDDLEEKSRPAVLIVHDWSGCNDFACQKAQMLAHLGYVGFAVDMYGEGRIGNTTDEKLALMQPLVGNRGFLQARITAALDAVKAISVVDPARIAVMGFCFGGLCALDLARSGADIVGAVSFHGLLHKPDGLDVHPIKARVLVLHGYDDPMVKPEHIHDFCTEMTDAGVDWQVDMYGQTQHAFTNPLAHDKLLGTVYNAQSARRSLLALTNFLEEVFA